MKTLSLKPKDLNKSWFIVDAAGQTVGRLSSELARVLQGKHKATYVPHLDSGDNVVVINADKIKFTGNKWLDKVYYRHSGYVGGIKASRAEEILKSHPERLIQIAVKGMLPNNKKRDVMLKNLKVYAGEQHPHEAQQPKPLPARTAERN
jgi:large subunit ribosomal protein L13